MPRDRDARLPQPLFDEPTFNEGRPTPDPTRFKVPHPSDAQLFSDLQDLLYEDVVGFPLSRANPAGLYSLETALGAHGPEVVQAIGSAGHIAFHMVGDIGASTLAKYPGEIRVSDVITADCHASSPADRPGFLYLLGDLVYDFGEAQYYYDQFYEPYRNYPGPIFAIPGNHDSFVVPGTPPGRTPLETFERNFCALEPTVTPEAGSLHRTAMTQPGVYFALEAPFVRVIGLFSNALEDPGLISSEGGRWSEVPDYQLDFLTAQLGRARDERYPGALLLAVHHPPFSYAPPAGGPGGGGVHGGNPAMLAQIDSICRSEGIYPHAVLSGHAHNYQRFTRSIRFNGRPLTVPFLVCGGGGHDVTPLARAHLGSPAAEPANGADVSYLDVHPAVEARGLVLDRHDDRDYGFLRVRVDARSLRFDFHAVGKTAVLGSPIDSVLVDLASHAVMASRVPTAGPAPPSERGRKGRFQRKRGASESVKE